MPYAIALFLDETSDQRVRRIWAALDANSVSSLATMPGASFPPHVTLTVFDDDDDPSRLVGILRPIIESAVGLSLPLAALGFFLTPEAPAFLSVAPSSRLLALHHQLHTTIQPLVRRILPYYEPDALVPHCTLALAATDRCKVIEVVSEFALPINAQAASAHLVEIYAATPPLRLA